MCFGSTYKISYGCNIQSENKHCCNHSADCLRLSNFAGNVPENIWRTLVKQREMYMIKLRSSNKLVRQQTRNYSTPPPPPPPQSRNLATSNLSLSPNLQLKSVPLGIAYIFKSFPVGNFELSNPGTATISN